MDQHVGEALVALAVIIIGSLGTLVAVFTERIKRNLDTNTQMTRETYTTTQSTLTDAMARVVDERNHVFALRMVLRERDDRLAYLVARHPEVEATLLQYTQRRRTHPSDADELTAEQHILDA